MISSVSGDGLMEDPDSMRETLGAMFHGLPQAMDLINLHPSALSHTSRTFHTAHTSRTLRTSHTSHPSHTLPPILTFAAGDDPSRVGCEQWRHGERR